MQTRLSGCHAALSGARKRADSAGARTGSGQARRGPTVATASAASDGGLYSTDASPSPHLKAGLPAVALAKAGPLPQGRGVGGSGAGVSRPDTLCEKIGETWKSLAVRHAACAAVRAARGGPAVRQWAAGGPWVLSTLRHRLLITEGVCRVGMCEPRQRRPHARSPGSGQARFAPGTARTPSFAEATEGKPRPARTGARGRPLDSPTGSLGASQKRPRSSMAFLRVGSSVPSGRT